MSSVHGSAPTRAYIFVCSMSHRVLVVHVITGSALSVNMRKSVKKCASCVAPARLRDAGRAAAARGRHASRARKQWQATRQYARAPSMTTACTTEPSSVPARVADGPPIANAATNQAATPTGHAAM